MHSVHRTVHRRTHAGAVLAVLAVVAAAPPVPPCAAPAGILPAVPECMCSSVVVPANAAGVAVRSYGLPTNEVLITNEVPGGLPYNLSLFDAVSNIFLYLEADNSAKRNFLSARTAPITVRPPSPPGARGSWFFSMMLSTEVFPDPSKVPTPNNFELHTETLTSGAPRLFAALAFNTTKLPSEAAFAAECAKLAKALPPGYQGVSKGWSPTYVIYAAQDAKLWTNECWTEVVAV